MYRFRDIAGYLTKVADFDPPYLHLAPPYGVTPVEFRGNLWHQKTRVPLHYFVWARVVGFSSDIRQIGGPIYKISYDVSYNYLLKFIVRPTYDSDLQHAEIYRWNVVSYTNTMRGRKTKATVGRIGRKGRF